MSFVARRALWKVSTGREPFKWLPLSFSSAIVWTAMQQQIGIYVHAVPAKVVNE
jgi:hypothetical protein